MVMTKPAALDKKDATVLLDNFLEQFQNWCNQHRPPNAAELEKYLCKTFQNYCNGELISKGFTEFANRIKMLQQKHSHTEISCCHDCQIAGNKAVIQFDVKLTERSGQKKELYVMAIATIEDHLITSWAQVSHTKCHAHK